MLGNLAPQVQQLVIERLEERPDFILMDTMNFWMDIALNELHKTLKLVDILSINDEEARQLSGEYSLVKAAKKIMEMGRNTSSSKKVNTARCSLAKAKFSMPQHFHSRKSLTPRAQATPSQAAL